MPNQPQPLPVIEHSRTFYDDLRTYELRAEAQRALAIRAAILAMADPLTDAEIADAVESIGR